MGVRARTPDKWGVRAHAPPTNGKTTKKSQMGVRARTLDAKDHKRVCAASENDHGHALRENGANNEWQPSQMRVRAQEMAKQYDIKKWRAREQIAKQREITNGRAASANERTTNHKWVCARTHPNKWQNNEWQPSQMRVRAQHMEKQRMATITNGRARARTQQMAK